MSSSPELAAAQAEVAAARARLLATVVEVQERLRPTNLVQDAVDGASQTLHAVARRGAQTARTRPIAVAAVAGGIGLYLARGWIGDILRRRKPDDETAAPPRGLDEQRASATLAKKGTAP